MNLYTKNCLPNPSCALCHIFPKDLDHLFRNCPKVTPIWLSLPSINQDPNLNFSSWLKFHCNHKKSLRTIYHGKIYFLSYLEIFGYPETLSLIISLFFFIRNEIL